MKADTQLLMKAAELGILSSIESFLKEPLKPGRLKRRFMEINMIVTGELRNMYKKDPNFYTDNKMELADYLGRFGKISTWGADKANIHVASVISFCLAFLEVSESKYTPKLIEYLSDVMEYYERVDNLKYSDMWNGRQFNEKWEALKNGQ